MRITALIARILLGLIFFVFGLNGFLHFFPMGPMPTGLAGQYITVMMQSHYFYFVAAVQVVGGALLLIGRYIPLGLTLLGPVIVNILIYHLLMELKGIPMAIIVTILWAIVFYRNRQYFSGVFAQKTA
jgi:putative oxidoreductase